MDKRFSMTFRHEEMPVIVRDINTVLKQFENYKITSTNMVVKDGMFYVLVFFEREEKE